MAEHPYKRSNPSEGQPLKIKLNLPKTFKLVQPPKPNSTLSCKEFATDTLKDIGPLKVEDNFKVKETKPICRSPISESRNENEFAGMETDLQKIYKRLDVVEKKQDATNKVLLAIKRQQELILNMLKSSLGTSNNARYYDLPLKSDMQLADLEKYLKADPSNEKAFHEQLSSEAKGNLTTYAKICVKNFFSHTGHFTWTGKSAPNAVHLEPPQQASELAAIRTAIDVAVEKFPIDRRGAEKAFRDELTNYNEAKANKIKREKK